MEFLSVIATDAQAGAGTTSIIGIVLYAVAMIGFVFFMFIRPNKKEKQRMSQMLTSSS